MNGNVDSLEAGRKLDLLVAKRVFSLVRNSGQGVSPHDNKTGFTQDVDIPLPRYSIHPGAAWEVVEKMRELGWWYTLSDERFAPRHHAEFRRAGEKGVHHFHRVIAETAPLAICRAALKAVGMR